VLVPGNYLQIPGCYQSISIIDEPLMNWRSNLDVEKAGIHSEPVHIHFPSGLKMGSAMEYPRGED